MTRSEFLLIAAYAIIVLAFLWIENYLPLWGWFASFGVTLAAPLVVVGLILSRGHR